jgi:hypothetical protein
MGCGTLLNLISETADIPILASAKASLTPSPLRRRLSLAAHFTAMVFVIIASLLYGLNLRYQAWYATTDIHFFITMNSAIRWGQRANEANAMDVYQEMVDDFGDDGRYKGIPNALALDYPPLRLLIIAKWEKWSEKAHPIKPGQQARWYPAYEFTRPMLWLNSACEIAGAVAMFLLMRFWLRRCGGAPLKPWLEPLCGTRPALLAALLLWFNPAVIFNAHCYPQWDVWILPFFLLAVYFGLLNFWLISGLCIGFVAMGKGQILLVTPALIIWQLCIGRPGAVLRLLAGIALASGLVASKWLLNNDQSFEWVFLVTIALPVGLLLFFYRGWTAESFVIHGVALLMFLALVLWPWMRHEQPPCFRWVFLTAVISIVAARFLPVRWAATWFATNLTVALFACVKLFGTSMDWYTVGIKGPTHNWQLLYWCEAMNLGAILQEKFGWEWHQNINLDDYLPKIPIPHVNPDPVSALLHPYINLLQFLQHPWIFPMRYLMVAAFGITLLLCGIAMAVHHRRKSPKFLFAMVAPWVLMFTLLPQMQNRYLVWAAAFSAATAAISLDGFMLYLLIAVISIADTAVDMMHYTDYTPLAKKWLPFLEPLFPDVAWAVMLMAGIWLYLALTPWRGKRTFLSAKPHPHLHVD